MYQVGQSRGAVVLQPTILLMGLMGRKQIVQSLFLALDCGVILQLLLI